MAKPPPLPPRNPSALSEVSSSSESTSGLRPPSYHTHLSPTLSTNHPYSGGFDDPRASSQQSLRPLDSDSNGRRTLLLIYIHGFLGDETSFRSFPAHVHNVLTVTLAETHVVHSKIYPRYKSRKHITFARDDFSKWLAPHESATTDIILVGHSLGGILATEVVLLPSHYDPARLRHRILGQIAFDTPFLGMHPGVIGTGIASLFRPAPDPPQQDESDATMTPLSAQTSTSGFSDLSLSPSDPNYNPTFHNDVRLANRQGKWERGWYFFNKHWGEVTKASKNYVTSHLEFGGCLMDYPGMKRRYDAVRELEDIDDFDPRTRRQRVRFVNYYSASTGRIQERKESPSQSKDNSTLQLPGPSSASLTPTESNNPSPRLSLEEHRDGEVVKKDLEVVTADLAEVSLTESAKDNAFEDDKTSAVRGAEMKEVDPEPLTDFPPKTSSTANTSTEPTQDDTAQDNLPPVPPLPTAPIAFDPSTCHDPDTLKLRQKEHDRAVKAYDRAVKEREKTIRDREKLVQKREKAAMKQKQKQVKEQAKRSNTLNPEDYDKHIEEEAQEAQPPINKQKDRKFCTLPGKVNGKRDSAWIRVYMEGMDEVVAHTSMFYVSETYAKLVGDTAERIEDWIQHELTRRAVMDAREDVD